VKRDIGYDLQQRLMAGNKVFGPLIGPGNDPARTVESIKEFGYDFFMIRMSTVLSARNPSTRISASQGRMNFPY